MATTSNKGNYYHSRTKSSNQKESRISDDFNWQPSIEDRILGMPTGELKLKQNSATDPPKETKQVDPRVANYKSIFGETTDVKNVNYINDLLSSKTKQREVSKQQEEQKLKKETGKKNQRASSLTSSAEPSKQLSPINISLKTPEKLTIVDPQKSQKSPEEELIGNNGYTVFAKMNVQYENPDSMVLSKVGTMNSIDTGKSDIQQMESIMTGSFVKVEDFNTQNYPNSQVSNFSSLVRSSKPEETDQPLSTDRKIKTDSQIRGPKTGTKLDMNNESIPLPEFVETINQYIDYFERPSFKDVFNETEILLNNTPRVQDPLLLQQEIKNLLLQNKQLHVQLEAYHKRIGDLKIMNQLLTNEVIGSRRSTNQLQEKLQDLEKKNIILSESYNTVKIKLGYTQELLTKEKFDNENNLFALKRVLSSSNISPYDQYLASKQRRTNTEGFDSNKQSFSNHTNLDKLFRLEQQQYSSHLNPAHRTGGTGSKLSGFGYTEDRDYKYMTTKQSGKLSELLKTEGDDDVTLQSSCYSDLEGDSLGSVLISRGTTPKYNNRMPSASNIKQNYSRKLTSAVKVAEETENLRKHKRVASTASRTSSNQYSNFSSDLLSKGAPNYKRNSGSQKLLEQISQFDGLLSKFENPAVRIRKRMDFLDDSSTTYDLNNDSF